MRFYFLLVISLLVSCTNDNAPQNEQVHNATNDSFLKAVDLSSIPEVNEYNITFFNKNSNPISILPFLKNNGVNTVRVRLWHSPTKPFSNFKTVKSFSKEIKNNGLKLWLTVHYSDSWADPSQQETPSKWKNLSFSNLKDSVYNYTYKIVSEINPEIIQIGNEINNGFLHPTGYIDNITELTSLLEIGCEAVRDASSSTKIMLHYAGHENAFYFFNEFNNLDFDYIGISYYPIWHGKDLVAFSNSLDKLTVFNKPFLIAETAYPFTLNWNDQTHNVVGLQNQLLDAYPATPSGQKQYLNKLFSIIKNNRLGKGIAYWGAELVAFKGENATDGSAWENQALFDFNKKALPAIDVFNEN